MSSATRSNVVQEDDLPRLLTPPFDPFRASARDAEAHPLAFKSPGGAFAQWAAAQQLISGRKFYISNPVDGMAVCARAGIVAPDWLAKAFLRGFYSVANHHVRTWDEAFGEGHPKSAKIEALRERKIARVRVAHVVHEFVQSHPDIPLSELFSAASDDFQSSPSDTISQFASRLGVKRTEADRLYRESVAMGIGSSAEDIRASLGWPRKVSRTRGLSRNRG